MRNLTYDPHDYTYAIPSSTDMRSSRRSSAVRECLKLNGWSAPADLLAPIVTTCKVLRRCPGTEERCKAIHTKFLEVMDVAAAIEQPQRELNVLRQSFRQDFGTLAPNCFEDAPWASNGRTPADALATNTVQQVAISLRIAQLELAMHRQLAVLEAEGDRLRQREVELRACAALQPTRLNNLPTHLLRRAIGLDGVFDPANESLLHYTGRCAKVCREWRQLVLHDPCYGGGLRPGTRSRVLAEISSQMLAARRTHHLCLDNLGWKWLEGGTESHWRIVAATLQAMPVPLGIHTMELACTGLTAIVVPQLS